MNRVRGILVWGILAFGLSIFGGIFFGDKAFALDATHYAGDDAIVLKNFSGAESTKFTRKSDGVNGHDGWMASNIKIKCTITMNANNSMPKEVEYTGNVYIEKPRGDRDEYKLSVDGECNKSSANGGFKNVNVNISKEEGSSPDVTNNTGDDGGDGGETEEAGSENNCSVPGLGWLVCPLVNLLGGASDAMYGMVSAMLEVDSSMFDATNEGRGSATYEIWKGMRNLANAIFVIMFLILIYSYLSGAGFSNYTIKKTLPRILIAALLVNISFYICAILVDISNISGSTLKTLLDNQTSKIEVSEKFGDQGNFFSNVATAIIVGAPIAGALSWAGVLVVLPTLVTVAAAIFTAFIVLAFRSALIVILTIISPLAFVSILLPNTEQWFNRWRKLFTTLILMYPAIALVFGGSAFAGKAIMSAANSSEPGDGDFTLAITGALIMVVPLFVTPIIMSTAGNFLGKIAGVVNNKDKGLIDRAHKGAKALQKRGFNYAKGRALRGDFGAGKFNPISKATRATVRGNAKLDGSNAAVNRAEAAFLSRETTGNAKFRNATAGGGWFGSASTEDQNLAAANAMKMADKQRVQDIEAQTLRMKSFNLSSEDWQSIAEGKTVFDPSKNSAGFQSFMDSTGGKIDHITQASAVRQVAEVGSEDHKYNLISKSADSSMDAVRGDIAEMAQAQRKTLGLSSNIGQMISSGQMKSEQDLMKNMIESSGKMSASQVGGLDEGAVNRLVDAYKNGNIPNGMDQAKFASSMNNFKNSASGALADESIRNNMKPTNISNLQSLVGQTTTASAPPVNNNYAAPHSYGMPTSQAGGSTAQTSSGPAATHTGPAPASSSAAAAPTSTTATTTSSTGPSKTQANGPLEVKIAGGKIDNTEMGVRVKNDSPIKTQDDHVGSNLNNLSKPSNTTQNNTTNIYNSGKPGPNFGGSRNPGRPSGSIKNKNLFK